ncbi:MAG TPA: dTMP kinase [Candidatus Hydrogenedentes bacterium]|nr:dTMP kinase [Candidatus Hydrogenedentota bacterium]HOV72933.1 dTMP kinase [Candidatus Hydrogenedentota bacterium]HPC15779.1 dTMP kinase [Candidatus Hydrogenedentota bacterium]HRT19813.1 dTMP kinase [Candidatus Hydrogenedentota bacterium]HRT64586.1 dTMP kinase [Candidatus Hydrogenedentota bacterium]
MTRKPTRGLFITFEGVEGCGKSTQAALLRAYLEARGRAVVCTREPGGTPIAEAIRRVLLDPAHGTMLPVTELLLYEAARAQHVGERIRPALAVGAVVICDRFTDSTTAYQCAGRGLGHDVVEPLHGIATGGLRPDITFVIDVPASLGLARKAGMGTPDRIERETLAFHERVRAEYLRIASGDPGRVQIVDGTRDAETVAAMIHGRIDTLLEGG